MTRGKKEGNWGKEEDLKQIVRKRKERKYGVLNMRLCTTMNRGKVRENKEEKKNNKITGQGDDKMVETE